MPTPEIKIDGLEDLSAIDLMTVADSLEALAVRCRDLATKKSEGAPRVETSIDKQPN